jgi:hypothetical protein
MGQLATQFKKNGYHYTQVIRDENKAIYKQEHKDITQVYYEVVKIKKSKNDYNAVWGLVPAGTESYPSTEAFGQAGWTFMNYETALTKFNQI